MIKAPELELEVAIQTTLNPRPSEFTLFERGRKKKKKKYPLACDPKRLNTERTLSSSLEN